MRVIDDGAHVELDLFEFHLAGLHLGDVEDVMMSASSDSPLERRISDALALPSASGESSSSATCR